MMAASRVAVWPASSARRFASRKFSYQSKMTHPSAQQSTSTIERLKIVGMRCLVRMVVRP